MAVHCPTADLFRVAVAEITSCNLLPAFLVSFRGDRRVVTSSITTILSFAGQMAAVDPSTAGWNRGQGLAQREGEAGPSAGRPDAAEVQATGDRMHRAQEQFEVER